MITRLRLDVFMVICILVFSHLIVSASDANKGDNRVIFPRAFAIAIDDLGWMEGSSLGNSEGPWRTGVRRSLDIRDYQPIVEIGKAMGIRLQGLFILGELDRLNIVAEKCPNASPFGSAYDNSPHVDRRQLDVMEYVKSNAAHLEFGLHGVGHEFWVDGERTRAEWYDLENNQPRDEMTMRNHLKCFAAIMSQYGLSPENGHSFPESFVPCAYGYYWNPQGSYSTGKIMSDFGIKYVNTLFSYIPELNPPPRGTGGFDNGVLVLDRFNYGNPWYELASLPRVPVEYYETDIIETHWPNLLAADDFLQADLNHKWISYLKEIQAQPNHYLAKNTEQLYSQWLYKRYTIVNETAPGKVTIENQSMPAEAEEYQLLSTMVLAIPLRENEHISRAVLDDEPIASYIEDSGYAYIYLSPLERKSYSFEYEIGVEPMDRFIYHSGTYNIYAVRDNGSAYEIDIKMYGSQNVEVRTPTAPISISSSNEYLFIDGYQYDEKNKLLSITITGRDIQGEHGTIILNF
jgi:hypothetical protein